MIMLMIPAIKESKVHAKQQNQMKATIITYDQTIMSI